MRLCIFWQLLGLGTLLLASCQQDAPQILRFSGATMGTTYTVTVVDPPTDISETAVREQVTAVLETVNAQMSTYRPDSDLSKFNAASADVWVPAADELVSLVERARDIGQATGGAFDVTIGPLVNLWGFGPQASSDSLPGEQAIQERMHLVGLERVTSRKNPPALRKSRAGITVDLSAIAKGYGVDRVAARLSALGAQRYLVEIGGELYGAGLNTQGVPWQIAVETPRAGPRRVDRVVALEDAGMATSGGYRNFFEVDGQRYSHTIDPHNGRPVRHDLRSVTVIAPQATQADALATALLVMGPEQGYSFAQAENLAALFIAGTDGAYTRQVTSSFKRYLAQ